MTSPAPFPVDISAMIAGSVDAEVVRADVNAFFRKNGFDWKKVTLARIGKILMDTGLVNDYENLTLNGQSASVHISDEQLPVCGVVSCIPSGVKYSTLLIAVVCGCTLLTAVAAVTG